jgi:Brp/Blh family beta-carotene 15,15'-monooxygenase
MALRVAKSNAPEIGRSLAVSPGRFPVSAVASIVGLIAALLLGSTHTDLSGNVTTRLLCLSLLMFGLPHGSLDIAIIRRSAALGAWQVGATILLYLGLATAMYAIWCFAAVLALAGFLVIASVHFADDWADELPPFFAIGTAVALLTTPTLLHHQAIADIFVSLTGQGRASVIADLSLLVAPVALIAAVTGIALMVRNDEAVRALETSAVVGGMLLLPPIAGFALFFCLSHSPKHFAAARAEVKGRDAEAVLFTCAAIGIAAFIYAARAAVVIEDGAIFASFVTLSILTVPHMIVPRIVKR